MVLLFTYQIFVGVWLVLLLGMWAGFFIGSGSVDRPFELLCGATAVTVAFTAGYGALHLLGVV